MTYTPFVLEDDSWPLGAASVGRCGICKRKLLDRRYVLANHAAIDCGGDCRGCISEIEANMGHVGGMYWHEDIMHDRI